MSKQPSPSSSNRRTRLAEALRHNLKRRKAQDRARSATADSATSRPDIELEPPASEASSTPPPTRKA